MGLNERHVSYFGTHKHVVPLPNPSNLERAILFTLSLGLYLVVPIFIIGGGFHLSITIILNQDIVSKFGSSYE